MEIESYKPVKIVNKVCFDCPHWSVSRLNFNTSFTNLQIF